MAPDNNLVVPASLAGERLDRSLALLFNLSRSQARKLITDQAVKLNRSSKVSPATQLQAGDQIHVSKTALKNLHPKLQPEPEVDVNLVYVDADLLVVNKPAGLVVHPGIGNDSGTLVAGLLARFPEIQAVGDPQRPGIVHRLDKGTSGLMVVARSARAHEFLTVELASRRVQRHYLAICSGRLENAKGIIEAPIGKSAKNPALMEVSPSGRPATTHYEVQQRLDAATVLRCRLETGRTHQIRVHLAAIGHPLLGDDNYNRNPLELIESEELKQMFHRRPALHSCQLSFCHPENRQQKSFSSAAPPDLAKLLLALGGGEE